MWLTKMQPEVHFLAERRCYQAILLGSPEQIGGRQFGRIQIRTARNRTGLIGLLLGLLLALAPGTSWAAHPALEACLGFDRTA